MTTPSLPPVTLSDGTPLPAVGFGTYLLNGSAGVAAMVQAMQHGYRLIDSAFNYENEGAVGEAVRQSGLPRQELLITSKLPGRRQRYGEALNTLQESLYRAGLDYYDLYLIHWPNPSKNLYVEAWQALIEGQRRGMVRHIGVCNFLPEHLNRLQRETGVLPCLNQIELHPYFPQEAQRAYHQQQGIVTESWSPLGRGNQLTQEPILQNIATRLGKSPAQVILRWHLQLGAIPLPKAASPARQLENLDLGDFALTPEDMAAIATLSRPDGRLANQDPAHYEEF